MVLKNHSLVLSFFFPFSHRWVDSQRQGERGQVVPIVKRQQRLYGAGITTENRSAMHVDSTTNYTT